MTLRLSDDMAAALEALAARNGVSISALLREGAMLRLAGVSSSAELVARVEALEARLAELERRSSS